jgi:RHS repeat-associated protein
MLGEYGASASDVVAETIWLQPRVATNDNAPLGGDDGIGGYAPLAVATGSGSGAALSWVHGNHLGVPIVTTDASGAGITPAGYTMAGFPGQTRTLGDLYYNRYRDYDSSTGRYIQADPIGLEGGSNPYLYADANPLRFTDSNGLTTLVYIRDKRLLRVKPEGGGRAYYVPATSGRPNCECDEKDRNRGPIPGGRYLLLPAELSNPGPIKDYFRNKLADWGDWRVPLHPLPGTKTHGRSGFKLHGGSLPGSAGCIDIGGGTYGDFLTNRVLRDLLRDKNGKVVVTVR